MAISKQSRTPLDALQQSFNDVLVQTGKALRNASRDKNSSPQSSVLNSTKIPASIDYFNAALDELEAEILRTKAVLQRDLNRVREKRKPPPEQRPVAPPAPMVVDLDSPKMTVAPAPTAPPPFSAFPGQNRTGKQESKPVAPFPNMGFDLTTSPEVAHAPSPKLSKTPKNSPRPTTIAGAAGKASNTPPKKDKAPTRPVTVTPVPVPVIPTATQVKAPAAQAKVATAKAPASGPVPMQSTTPIPVPLPVAVPTPNPIAAQPPAQAPIPTAPMPATTESIFTDMTFSLAPPSSDGPTASQTQDIDLVNLGAGTSGDILSYTLDSFGSGSGPAHVANMGLGQDDTNMSNVNAKIDELFDLGPGGMDSMDIDYNFEEENSNFNDVYFEGEDNMGPTEFDSNFFDM